MNISVIIPAYNAEDTIAQTLDALIRQTRAPYEVIVVDNDSRDKTIERVEKFIRDNPGSKITLCKESKKGPSAARNRGALLSSGDALAFIDADEEPPQNWVQVIEEEFDRGSDAVWGPVTEYNTDTFLRKYLDVMQRAALGKREVIRPDVRNDRFVFAGNFAIKKDLFFLAGNFDEGMKTGEDLDLSKRIYRAGKPIVYNPQMLAIHNHRETFGGRFEKGFGYGILQARFLKEYYGREFNIVFSGRKTVSFAFPLKVRIQFFSIFNALLLIYIMNFFNKSFAILLAVLLALGIGLKVAHIALRSGRRFNVFLYILYAIYWSAERLAFDIGRIWGSFKYRVICI